ncbi:transposase family protein [Frankia sp. Cr2]|uniref:transposase family protein n=1 Tax=Frankia sp. Cr2 TaxID=3073932 RepID=UPI003A0FEA03
MFIDRVVDEGSVVRVVARTRAGPLPCPRCGTVTTRVHGYQRRRLADLPVGGRPTVIEQLGGGLGVHEVGPGMLGG